MSCDFGVWFPHRRLSHEAAGALYAKLCEGELDEVRPHPAVDAFYNELTTLYPELDTIPDERIGDHDFCPWSCVIERSPGHLILLCVWSQASRVEALVKELARRHGLSLYDPQAGILHNPDDPPTKGPRRPWWRIW